MSRINHYEDVIINIVPLVYIYILPHHFALNIDKNVSIRGPCLKTFKFFMALYMVCIYISTKR